MGMNIQHPAPNTQRPTRPPGRCSIGCRKFLFFIFLLAAPLLFGQSGTNALPKLLPPYGKMPPTFWEQHGTNIIIASIALVVLAGGILWWICRPKPPVVVPPEIQAREALARWADRPEDGNCLSKISQILRRYFICAFEFPAGEFTTAEFCRELERNEKIGPELTRAIAGFLRECDKQKFSPAGSPASLNAAGRALDFVAIAEKIRAGQDVYPAEK
jgi:hypothetical protein